MKIKNTGWVISALIVLIIGCSKKTEDHSKVIDIDGNEYDIIEIGAQFWTKQNLKTTRYNDGIAIPKLEEDEDWESSSNGAWSYYNNESSNNNEYGKLYNAYAAMSGKLCPTGWRIPNNDDWQDLIDFLGGDGLNAGGALKSITGWNAPNTGATNTTGFTALPGGSRHYSGIYNQMLEVAYFWSSSSIEDENTLYYGLESSTTSLFSYSVARNYGFSCRCIKGIE
jgi:uncharacterized protein (TIGR02145 family)